MASQVRSTGVLALALLLAGCFPSFDSDGKDRCAADEDCTDGRICSIPEGVELLGTCVPAGTDSVVTPEECIPFDQDADGSYTDPLCGEGLDCDDGDARRSPFLPELCDGVDNDCDDEIDEGLRNACGGCDTLPTEVCNGLDDDCDGVVDDGVTNACGGCGEPLPEWCDGEDNNCDGQVDEGLDCACEEGEERGCPNLQEVSLDLCRQGRQDCENGRWGACRNPVITTGVETCDQRDNNCDDVVDEGFDLARDASNCGACGVVCSTLHARVSACAQGACNIECRPGYADLDGRSDTGCETPCSPTGEEVCGNGLDDDCDGEFDEDCGTALWAGTYAWINLFGRAAEGQPPGLVTGILTVTESSGRTVTIEELVRYTTDDEDGMARFSRTSTRTYGLDATGALVLTPRSEEDPLGGVYRGQLTHDTYRSFAVLMEYDGERQIASMALLVRMDAPDTAAVDHTHIRGPYHALHFLPDRLLTARLSPGPISISGWSLDATAPLGSGAETFLLDGTAGLTTSSSTERPLSYLADAGRTIEVKKTAGDGATTHYAGPADPAGGTAVLAIAADQDGIRGPFEPGLVVLTERRESPRLVDLEGSWTIAGLQTRYVEDERKIQYNAVQQDLEFESAQGFEHLRIMREIEGEVQDVGTVTVGPASTGEVPEEVRVSLISNDNLDRPRIEMRGALNLRRDSLVLWEIADLGDGLPVTSIFFALRRGADSE